FHKGRVLYGLPEARRLLAAAAPDAAPPLVVVAGYMDVIACQRAGIAAVAPLGTALTEEQMELLWRRHPEPTLCFDGDRAGRQAAFRALDRALPLLTPGRSFRFSVVEGGKDPDDVLREQGAAALRSQLSRTVGFAETLFRRELESEPLDTPERRAGLKARLRAAASRIADRDLQAAYRDDLLARFEAALPARAPSGPGSDFRGRGAGRGRSWIDPAPTSLGRSAARRLAAALDGPAAALMKHALADPACLDDHLESPFAAGGFGEPDLAGLAKEIIRLRLESEHLDSQGLARHLASIDFEVLLTDIDRAAAKSGAPFLKPDVSLEDARSQWLQAFARLSRLAALDEAVSTAKGDLGGSLSMDAFSRLKGERDRLRRQIRNWQDEP
ncbi:toprim domain-containing protein, partial [Phenylobacterium sp.]|uniref:toprim domain-containing protein n=1 Tax=Phenylobacterium sp. TaxID=1871053 RepID=UPI0025F3807E